MPQRARRLFDKLAGFDNLLTAYSLARKAGRAKSGPVAFASSQSIAMTGIRQR